MPGEVNRMDGNERFRQLVHTGNPGVLGSLLEELGRAEAKKLIEECYREQPETALVHCAKRAGEGRHRKETELLECVRQLLAFGAQINEPDCTKRTALHWSCWHGNESLSTLLLDSGADPNLPDAAGFNCLLTAISSGALDCVRLLLARRKELLHRRGGGTGLTPLLAAVQKGDAAVVAALVAAGADVNAQEDASKRTPLHYALYTKKRELFEYLLQHGADLTRTDHRGTNILHRCCTLQDPGYLRLVLASGLSAPRTLSTHAPPSAHAHLPSTPLGTALRMGDGEGATPVIVACQNGNLEQLKMLVEAGAPVATKDKFQRCALHHCVENPATECAEYLLRAIPSLLTCADEEGLTPLHMAVIAGNVPLVKLLLKRGANLRAVDNEKHTVVHWATVCGHADVLDLLIENGADVSAPDRHQAFPVHYAAQMMSKKSGTGSDSGSGGEGSLHILKTLLKHKVSPEAEDKDKRTPIIWAASAGSSAACRVLISAGADVNRADKDDLTALHCAASRGHHSCVETLIKNCKATVDPVDKNQCTPLFYATTLGHIESMKVLLTHGADCSHTDTRGRTAAHCATVSGLPEALAILKEHKVDLWTQNLKGDLPLHEAAQAGHLDLVQYLLVNSDGRPRVVDIGNRDGRTCLHIASLTNNVWLCRFLLERGANVNAIMRNKGKFYSPYDAALIKGHSEAKDVLLQQGGRPGAQVTSHAAQTIQVRYRYHRKGRQGQGRAAVGAVKVIGQRPDSGKRKEDLSAKSGSESEKGGAAGKKNKTEKAEKKGAAVLRKGSSSSSSRKSESNAKKEKSSKEKKSDSEKIVNEKDQAKRIELPREDAEPDETTAVRGSEGVVEAKEEKAYDKTSEQHVETPHGVEAEKAGVVQASAPVGSKNSPECKRKSAARTRSKSHSSSSSSSESSSDSESEKRPQKPKYVSQGSQITTGATEVYIDGETLERPRSAKTKEGGEKDNSHLPTAQEQENESKQSEAAIETKDVVDTEAADLKSSRQNSLQTDPKSTSENKLNSGPKQRLNTEDTNSPELPVPSPRPSDTTQNNHLDADSAVVVSSSLRSPASSRASRRGHRSPRPRTSSRHKRNKRDRSSDSEKSYRSSSSSSSHGTTSDIESSSSERLSKSKSKRSPRKDNRQSVITHTPSTQPSVDGKEIESKKPRKKSRSDKVNGDEREASAKRARSATSVDSGRKQEPPEEAARISVTPKEDQSRARSATTPSSGKSPEEYKTHTKSRRRHNKSPHKDKKQEREDHHKKSQRTSEPALEPLGPGAKEDPSRQPVAPVEETNDMGFMFSKVKKSKVESGGEYSSDFSSESASDGENHKKLNAPAEDDQAYTDMEDSPEAQDHTEKTTSPRKRKTRPNKLIQSIQESVRRYERERQSIRQLHQVRRAQIYSGPTWDVALFRKIVGQHGSKPASSSTGDGTPQSAATTTAVTWEEYLQEQLRVIQEERKSAQSPRKPLSAHPQSRHNSEATPESKRTPRNSFQRQGDTASLGSSSQKGPAPREKSARQASPSKTGNSNAPVVNGSAHGHAHSNGAAKGGEREGVSPLRRAQTARGFRTSNQSSENHQEVTTSPLDMSQYDDPRKFSSREATRLRHEHAQMQLVKAYRPFGGISIFRGNTFAGFPPATRGGVRPQSTMSSRTSASAVSSTNGRPPHSRGTSRDSEHTTVMTTSGSRRVRTPSAQAYPSQYPRQRYPLIFKDPDEYERSRHKSQELASDR